MAAPRICSVEGCDKRAVARGWCDPHYRRWKKYGDTDGHSASYGAAKHFFEVTIPSHDSDECLIWPFYRNGLGYAVIKRGGKTHLVSRLVCEEEHGSPPTTEHQAAHSCGNGYGGCVNKQHLSWKTPTENVADRIDHGTYQFGTLNHQAKITENDVRRIRCLAGALSHGEIGERFGLDRSTVRNIIARRIWKWLD